MNRTRPGSSYRPGSAVGDSQRMLQDTVVRLEQELMDSRAQTKKVSDQLTCLMLLVKRAWSGDKSAATNVANIVGAAPPDFDESLAGSYTTITAKTKDTAEEEMMEPPRILMKNKSRPLNNWALLVIGVLNREYRRLEAHQELKVKLYFQNRQRYLEEQLVYHRDVRVRDHAQTQEYDPVERLAQPTPLQTLEPSHKPLRRSNSLTELGSMRQRAGSVGEQGNKAFITQPNTRQQNARPQSTKVRSTRRPLYRPASGIVSEQNSLTWADLVIEPGQPHTGEGHAHMMGESQYKMADRQNDKMEKRQRTKYRVPYDHPDRYTVNGLYDAENALGPGNKVFRKRPPSAKDQRQSDNMRARPKSAVYGHGERPLKYETTRPVSAVVSKSKHTDTTPKRRPPSGKKPAIKAAFSGKSEKSKTNTNSYEEEDLVESAEDTNGRDHLNDSTEDVEKLIYDDKAFAKLGVDLKEVEREVRLARAIRANIEKPQCVLDFEKDVREMVAMEKQIRKTTEDLQRKLGICENGMV